MASFADLQFSARYPELGSDDIQARMTFENGYGASVIRGVGSYGSEQGLYELAITHPDIGLVYDTPITDDVLGFLSEDAVSEALESIAALPPRSVAA